jgi:hypothetical protein
VFKEDFLYSTRERDWASFAFGTLLSKYGCMTIGILLSGRSALASQNRVRQ